MADVQRYDCADGPEQDPLEPCPEGPWVRYEDYAAQQAGAEAYILLRGQEIVRLKAERDALAAERDALEVALANKEEAGG